MGRVKLKIKRLENSSSRQVTYSKRKAGVMKKAKELSILCDIDLVLLMFAPNGKPTVCVGDRSNIEEVVARFSQVSQQERAKRKLESLEALKKTFKKLDHDVNIQEFLGPSYWADPDEISDIDHIRAMEQSLKKSLSRIQAHKENFGRQLISVDCCGQNDIHLHSGFNYEQGASPVSWLHNNDGQQLMLPQDSNLLSQRDIGCSADTPLQNCNAYFSTGEQTDANEQVQEGSLHEYSPNACLRLQLGGQYPYQSYCQNLVSERTFKPDAENSLQDSTIDYQVNHFDASFQNWASTSATCGVSMYDEQSYTQQHD
ncbi:MADS-box transcription factor 68 [Musa troglodytarum]|nr:MADS-box transcription factor 68 [Musa troglodytarum]